MRFETTVTSISWIPSEAIAGLPKLPFSFGTFHYDEPPPDTLGSSITDSLETLRVGDRFRFANHLAAWIEVDEHGRITDCGYAGGGSIGATRVKMGPAKWFVTASALPDRQSPPEHGDGWVRFTQTAGGRTGVPAPRTVRHPPFVQYRAPIAWTTLSLTLHADGRSHYELSGASPFPRHWVYDASGTLQAKSGVTRFKDWWQQAFGTHTPWGDLDSPALVTAVETDLERRLSSAIMGGATRPTIRKVNAGAVVTRQGDTSDELYLLLDGVVSVDIDGTVVAEIGPGAVVGERAQLEGGVRSATLRAVTACRLAAIDGATVDREALAALASVHRRESR